MAETFHTTAPASPEDYLKMERGSALKHEYVDGVVYAMTGGTARHGLVAGNFFASLHHRLPAHCSVFMNNLKSHIRTELTERYYYPDITVTCGQQNQSSDICGEPLIIIEVLSPSTARLDRAEKFQGYKLIPSLAEYVLVSQNAPQVEIFRRAQDWRHETYGAGQSFALTAVALDFEMEDIYRRVEFGGEAENG